MQLPPNFSKDKGLRDHCTFGIGGCATYFVEVGSVKEMQETLHFCRTYNLNFFILGKGSNTLFSEKGFNGVVILNKIHFIENPEPHLFHVGAGYSFSLLGSQTARQGWTGLEFASGIPGTVGGAVFMNAGANGAETCQALASVDFVDAQGTLHTYLKEELTFSYRTSSFQTMPGAIVCATFALTPSDTARKKQLDLIHYRQKTQPYKEKSAGCVFQNPKDASAGALIEACGLKGMSIGGAQISPLHANFIINNNNATTHDILSLISLIQAKVLQTQGYSLESEIRFIPDGFEEI